MVHVVESVINRKYGGWFVRNTEHAQRVYDALKASPLPITKPVAGSNILEGQAKATAPDTRSRPANAPWGNTPKKVEFAS